MIFLEDCSGISKGAHWEFYGILIHWIPMGFLWYFYDGSMIFLWGFYWIPVGFLLDSCGISKVFP